MRRSPLSLADIALPASVCGGGIAQVAGVALDEEEMLPSIDAAYTFLDLLDRLARMDR
jgi:hypothetical protein